MVAVALWSVSLREIREAGIDTVLQVSPPSEECKGVAPLAIQQFLTSGQDIDSSGEASMGERCQVRPPLVVRQVSIGEFVDPGSSDANTTQS